MTCFCQQVGQGDGGLSHDLGHPKSLSPPDPTEDRELAFPATDTSLSHELERPAGAGCPTLGAPTSECRTWAPERRTGKQRVPDGGGFFS